MWRITLYNCYYDYFYLFDILKVKSQVVLSSMLIKKKRNKITHL